MSNLLSSFVQCPWLFTREALLNKVPILEKESLSQSYFAIVSVVFLFYDFLFTFDVHDIITNIVCKQQAHIHSLKDGETKYLENCGEATYRQSS